MSPSSLSSKALITGFKGNSNDSFIMDDLDGRTRNAKAQKRHREKQKARVKALEESVQVLTVQLEDARRQLGQLPYPPGPSRLPITSHSPEFTQLQAENNYLREENADLRRQIYSLRSAYGGQDGPGPEGVQSPPPRQGSSSTHGHARAMTTNASIQSTPNPEGNSASSSSSSFQPGVDHYSQTPRGSRNRVLSASSAPSTSPYVNSSSFPADLRVHSLSNNGNSSATSTPNQNSSSNSNGPTQIESRYPVRYESHLYAPTAPPPHALPRSQMYNNVEGMGYGRGEGEGMWGPESGPPPFAGAMGYPSVNYENSSSVGQPPEPWRQDH
ncbi:hypothetical protein CI109_105034 [Kwoniella shandongensis]|uniref:Uncharacterized protein n=1 Tax=Kwoniella shandongensis TaxID=1734106 RepID=A0A5M6BWP6_9TREE|nr:uncharacterized protein CI109_004367 [Kwoniella shandongensis]KAA5527307.1 hypothetical protein CI109_004367 [Kwoniella shandongensis]